jgi:uncharacterized protein YyaL (SSP411 family)
MAEHAFTNHLANETSPYLLQHAHNPVDWYPWGTEALERSKREDKPIFLSIGYSACHWCHVMEHESFEDPATAAVMNEHFVNVKVDREERPDLDHIYMAAVQLMTRHGGWPMSVFLTPELEPFYGGTYFPPQPRHGMPSFQQVLLGVADAWRNRRGEISRSAIGISSAIKQMNEVVGDQGTSPGLDLIDGAVRELERSFDPGYGGFGSAPKFPHPMDLKVCLRHWQRTASEQSMEIVRRTLDHMARGGIYDQLGGGFHRYSTDERWLVPHFEKMLYDNALLTQTYLEAFQAFREPAYARVARETLDYVLREMTAPEGGFYSTQDADSEGVEGKYFVWSLDELERVLGKDAARLFAYVYDVTAEGNWEEHNILNRPKTEDQCARLLGVATDELERSLAESRAKLFAVRAARIAPGRDDKILVAWNGLMIDAMARGFQVLGDRKYLEAAQRAASFILNHMCAPADSAQSSTRLRHSYKDGQARFNAYLDDVAALIDGLVSLFESDFDARWLASALDLAAFMLDQYWDDTGGSFFYTPRQHETLITRVRDAHDGATPSGNSLAVTALARLGRLSGRGDLAEKAERALQSFAGVMGQAPRASGQMLVAVDFIQRRPIEIVVAAPPGESGARDAAAALEAIRQEFLPSKVLVMTPANGPDAAAAGGMGRGGTIESLIPLVKDKPAVGGRVTAYICENYACRAPVVGIDEIRKAIHGYATAGANA